MNEFFYGKHAVGKVVCLDNGTAQQFFTIGKTYFVFEDFMETDTDLPVFVGGYITPWFYDVAINKYFEELCGARFKVVKRRNEVVYD